MKYAFQPACSFSSIENNASTFCNGSLFHGGQANGEAAQGKYVAGTCVGAAAAYDLFVKNHAY